MFYIRKISYTGTGYDHSTCKWWGVFHVKEDTVVLVDYYGQYRNAQKGLRYFRNNNYSGYYMCDWNNREPMNFYGQLRLGW